MIRALGVLLTVVLATGAAAEDAPVEAEGAPAAAAPQEPPPDAAAPRRFGVSLDREKPLEIRADEFEAAPGKAGGKHFTFRKNVEVNQADLSIRAERLDAYYGPKAKDPDRLEASGNVVVVQGDREARCETATYVRASDSLVCRGDAELRDGRDRVRGQVIEFDLAAQTVTVTGGAELELHPRSEAAPGPTPGEEGS